MERCVICSSSAELTGALCPGCAQALRTAPPRAPGIVRTEKPRAVEAWLIDAWGVPHPIGARCAVGRDSERNDVSIADLLVSEEHAELSRAHGGWEVRDRGSSNGTRVGDSARVRKAQLSHRAKVWFGAIGFYFWGQPSLPVAKVAAPRVRTVVPDGGSFLLAAPRRGELFVRPAAGHELERAPGELEYHAPKGKAPSRSALGRLQFQLLRKLCESALSARAGAVSGSVGTQELVKSLPFQSSQPDANHVRQVVANLRAALERAGVPGGGSAGDGAVVAAEEGLGYRVTWSVERTGRS